MIKKQITIGTLCVDTEQKGTPLHVSLTRPDGSKRELFSIGEDSNGISVRVLDADKKEKPAIEWSREQLGIPPRRVFEFNGKHVVLGIDRCPEEHFIVRAYDISGESYLSYDIIFNIPGSMENNIFRVNRCYADAVAKLVEENDLGVFLGKQEGYVMLNLSALWDVAEYNNYGPLAGYIEFLGSNGKAGETQEFASRLALIEVAKRETNYGVPMKIYLNDISTRKSTEDALCKCDPPLKGLYRVSFERGRR